ncbi:hypothetical protein GmHk_12G035545 [Glycine max]|nr:hypothetical protein GmHk_12G035545 [Glycine max]
MERVAEPHHVLYVVNVVPEKRPQHVQELLQPARQAPPGQDLNQVPEIVRAVKRHPTHRVVADESRGHHEFGEQVGVDALRRVAAEVDSLAAEEIDGVRRVGVTLHVEVTEVEFPDEAVGGSEVGEISVGIRESETDLDQVKCINVGLEKAVVDGRWEVGFCGVYSVGTENDAGEFGVHGNERVIIDDLTNQLEFGFEVGCPDLADQDGLGMIRVFF